MSSVLNSSGLPPSGPPTAWSRGVVAGLCLGVVAVLVWLHAVLLAPFVLSLALAYVLQPLVERLTMRRVPRALAVAVCLCGAVLLALVLLLLLVPIMVELAPMLRQQLPELAARGWHVMVPWLTQIGVTVPAKMADLQPLLVSLLNSHGEQWASAALSSLRMGGSLLMTLTGLAVLVPLLAFYWLMDWARLMANARDLVPMRWRDRSEAFMAEADEVLGQYLRGQILVMLILAVYYSVGLLLCGFNLALPIGVFTGLAVFIPYLGFGLGLLLALMAGLLQFAADPAGLWWPVVTVAAVYGLGQIIEGFLLTPRLVGQRIGLHPAGVIFVLMLFGKWMGFVGVLMALPLSALMMVVLRRSLRHYRQSRLYQDLA
jgi:predicted PurR-regulated permease PerM